jgi:Tfp pilus assembly protein PilE
MAQRQRSFFIELILVILFFSISAMVVLQIFLKSHEISGQSAAKTGAVFAAESAIERVRASDSGDFSLFQQLPDADGSLTLGYDGDWRPVTENPVYLLTVTCAKSSREVGSMVTITAKAASAEGEEILTLTGQKYCPAAPAGEKSFSETN